jgi:hypothetical protein
VSDAHVLYVVVSKDGDVRSGTRSGLHVYRTLSKAQAQCRRPGDSVVEAVVNLDREPLFIREKKVGA